MKKSAAIPIFWRIAADFDEIDMNSATKYN
jgi:hypothetical protein